jgi:predicted permease
MRIALVQNFLLDVRYALRQMRLAPAFTLTAVLTLAIGIGATTAIFTLVHAIMLKSLPVADPERLYRIGDTQDCCIEGWEDDDWSIFSYQLYQRLAAAAPEFEETTAFQGGMSSFGIRGVSRDQVARPLQAEFVTGNYFHVLGIGALSGRVFSQADDTQSAPPTAVMSYRTWQQAYGADPTLIGSTFVIEGQPVTLIGIAPPGFFGETLRTHPPDFWLPLQQEFLYTGQNSLIKNNQSNWLYIIGRLRPSASVEGIPARLTPVLQRWLKNEDPIPADFRPQIDPTIPHKYIRLTPAGGGVARMKEDYGASLRILLAVCGTVLLIACANIANLLLARAAVRRLQTAMRIALGASRKRLIRQQLTEAVVLALVGGTLGIGVAYLSARLMLRLAFSDAPAITISITPSWPVFGFAFALSLLTGILFGVVPAWLASHSDPAEALHGANRSTRERSSLPQKAMVVGQAALSLVLLACAGLLASSLRNLERQDFGFAVNQRVSVAINPPSASYTPEQLDALYREIEDRLGQLPNIKSTSLALYSPMSGDNWGEMIAVEGKGDPKPSEENAASWDRVSRQYFSTIGENVVRGRDFDRSDTSASRPVAIINEAFAKRFFVNEDPIGRHFGLDMARFAGTYEIVGVVRDAKYTNPQQPANPMCFMPLEQTLHHDEPLMQRLEIKSHFMNSIQLQVQGDTSNLEPQLRRALAEIDPTLTIVSVQSMQQQVRSNFDQQRVVAQLAGVFGAIALLLAGIGVYGLTAYTVARRTSEIGLRMALGANHLRIVVLVLRGAFLQLAIGLVIGIPVAIGVGRLMASQLFQVRSWDLPVLAISILSLGLCGMVASILPAARAASIDPVKALRAD